MASSAPDSITLAVLAGGAGVRMGRPKSHLAVGDQSVLRFLLNRLQWPGPTLLITAPGREHPPGWETFDREVPDPTADEGPLRGLHTALSHAATECVACVAVDMPGMIAEDLAWLAASLSTRPDTLGVMTRRAGQIEPLPSLWRIAAIDLVASRLATGRRSLHGLSEDPRVQLPSADDRPARAWLNANTPDEWERLVWEMQQEKQGRKWPVVGGH